MAPKFFKRQKRKAETTSPDDPGSSSKPSQGSSRPIDNISPTSTSGNTQSLRSLAQMSNVTTRRPSAMATRGSDSSLSLANVVGGAGKSRAVPRPPARFSIATSEKISLKDALEPPHPQSAPRHSLTGYNDSRRPSRSLEPIYGKVDMAMKRKNQLQKSLSPNPGQYPKGKRENNSLVRKVNKPERPLTSSSSEDSDDPLYEKVDRLEPRLNKQKSDQMGVAKQARFDFSDDSSESGTKCVPGGGKKEKRQLAISNSAESKRAKAVPNNPPEHLDERDDSSRTGHQPHRPTKPPRKASSSSRSDPLPLSVDQSTNEMSMEVDISLPSSTKMHQDKKGQHKLDTFSKSASQSTDVISSSPSEDESQTLKTPLVLGARPKASLNQRVMKKPGEVKTVPKKAGTTLNKRALKPKNSDEKNPNQQETEPAPKFLKKKDALKAKLAQKAKEKSIADDPRENEENLPNFQMEPASNVSTPKKNQAKDMRTIVNESSADEEHGGLQLLGLQNQGVSSDSDDLLDDLSLFSKTQKIPAKKKVVKEANPPPNHGLTPEEEKQLEEAKRAEEDKRIWAEKQRRERMQKAAEDRKAKKMEELQKIDKTRNFHVQKDLRAMAKKGEGTDGVHTTENLRHQLRLFGPDTPDSQGSKTQTVELEIDDDDDDEFLPIRRNRDADFTSSSSEDEEDIAKRAVPMSGPGGSAKTHFFNHQGMNAGYKTRLEGGDDGWQEAQVSSTPTHENTPIVGRKGDMGEMRRWADEIIATSEEDSSGVRTGKTLQELTDSSEDAEEPFDEQPPKTSHSDVKIVVSLSSEEEDIADKKLKSRVKSRQLQAKDVDTSSSGDNVEDSKPRAIFPRKPARISRVDSDSSDSDGDRQTKSYTHKPRETKVDSDFSDSDDLEVLRPVSTKYDTDSSDEDSQLEQKKLSVVPNKSLIRPNLANYDSDDTSEEDSDQEQKQTSRVPSKFKQLRNHVDLAKYDTDDDTSDDDWQQAPKIKQVIRSSPDSTDSSDNDLPDKIRRDLVKHSLDSSDDSSLDEKPIPQVGQVEKLTETDSDSSAENLQSTGKPSKQNHLKVGRSTLQSDSSSSEDSEEEELEVGQDKVQTKSIERQTEDIVDFGIFGDNKMTKSNTKPHLVPILKGPMKFSIDSYDSRDRKEVPYTKKLIRTESLPNWDKKSKVEPKVEVSRQPMSLVNTVSSSSSDGSEHEDLPRGQHKVKPSKPKEVSKPHMTSTSFQGISTTSENHVQYSRNLPTLASTPSFAAKKTSLERTRIVPNDDLVLNLRRKASFGNTTEAKTDFRKIRLSKAKSTSLTVDQIGAEIGEIEFNLRSIDDDEAKVRPKPSQSVLDTLASIKHEFLSRPPELTSSAFKAERPILSHQSQSIPSYHPSPKPKFLTGQTTIQEVRKAVNPRDVVLEEKRLEKSLSLQESPKVPKQRVNSLERVKLRSIREEDKVFKSRQSHKSSDDMRQLSTPVNRSQINHSPARSVWEDRIDANMNKERDFHVTNHEAFNNLPPNLKAYISKVEANSKQGKFDPKVMVTKSWKRPSLSQLNQTDDAHEVVRNKDILAAAKKPSASIGLGNPTPKEALTQPAPKKPQFYFGQPDLKSIPSTKSLNKSTAIEKVKNNEAMSHPRNIIINPGYKIKDYVDPVQRSGMPSFAFGDTPPLTPKSTKASPTPRPELNSKSTLAKLESQQSVEPPVKPVVINYSKFLPPDSNPDFRIPRFNKKPGGNGRVMKEKSPDDLRIEYEQQLQSGKARLKPFENGMALTSKQNNSKDETDSGISMVPSPPPPPPPQFNRDHFANKPSIPIHSTQPAAAWWKGQNSPGKKMAPPKPGNMNRGSDGRASLMSAIRATGGINGLRKTNSGKNL